VGKAGGTVAGVAAVPGVDELRALGLDAGLDDVGVAPAEPFESTRRDIEDRKAAGLSAGMAFTFRNPARSTDPSRALPGARSLVVGARSYLMDDPPGGSDASARGKVARYSWLDHYRFLRDGLAVIAARLRQDGWRAVVLADDNALVDREAAYRAGLGWYGKNANLLLPGRGSWFVLGSVVTDAPLPASGPPQPDGCGACHRCLDGCPTGAIVAPGVVDASRCLAWLVQRAGIFPREFRVALGDRIYGCDDCQEVCPPNRRPRPVPAAEGGGTADSSTLEATVGLLEMLAASDEELLERHGRWYIAGRSARWLRRNALIALGNVGDGRDAAVADAIRGALLADDPMVRAPAVWAADRLGLGDELALVRDDATPEVVAELQALATESVAAAKSGPSAAWEPGRRVPVAPPSYGSARGAIRERRSR
jgi:epoxyqueuosine reductase